MIPVSDNLNSIIQKVTRFNGHLGALSARRGKLSSQMEYTLTLLADEAITSLGDDFISGKLPGYYLPIISSMQAQMETELEIELKKCLKMKLEAAA